jgi:hypothetical protein
MIGQRVMGGGRMSKPAYMLSQLGSRKASHS